MIRSRLYNEIIILIKLYYFPNIFVKFYNSSYIFFFYANGVIFFYKNYHFPVYNIFQIFEISEFPIPIFHVRMPPFPDLSSWNPPVVVIFLPISRS